MTDGFESVSGSKALGAGNSLTDRALRRTARILLYIGFIGIVAIMARSIFRFSQDRCG